jgi:hypothetical protein
MNANGTLMERNDRHELNMSATSHSTIAPSTMPATMRNTTATEPESGALKIGSRRCWNLRAPRPAAACARTHPTDSISSPKNTND